MHMWLWLATVMVVRVAQVMVGMVMVVSVIMVIMVMMAKINMTKFNPVMGVNEKAGKGTGRHCCSQTECRGHGEHDNHRPDKGNVASAYSFQLRQHRLSYLGTAIRHPRAL